MKRLGGSPTFNYRKKVLRLTREVQIEVEERSVLDVLRPVLCSDSCVQLDRHVAVWITYIRCRHLYDVTLILG